MVLYLFCILPLHPHLFVGWFSRTFFDMLRSTRYRSIYLRSETDESGTPTKTDDILPDSLRCGTLLKSLAKYRNATNSPTNGRSLLVDNPDQLKRLFNFSNV